MAPNRNIEKAWKALKPLGVPKYKVKAKLMELLKIYDNQWQLIEDENYRVLIDAIMDKETETQGVQPENKTPISCKSQESEPLPKRWVTRYQKRMGSSANYSSTCTSLENKEEDVNGFTSPAQNHVEPERFKSLKKSSQSRKRKEVPASISNSQKEQAMVAYQTNEAPLRYEIASEPEDIEIPLKGLRRKRQLEQVSNSMNSQLEFVEVPLRVLLNELKISHNCNEDVAEPNQLHSRKEQINKQYASPSKNAAYKRRKASSFQTCSKVGKIESSQDYTTETYAKSPRSSHGAHRNSMSLKAVPCMNLDPTEYMLNMSNDQLLDVPISVVLPGVVPCLTYRENNSDKNGTHPKADDLESTGTKSSGDKDGDSPMQLCEIGSSDKNSSNANLKLMDHKCEEKNNSVSKLDVASSPKNEVKLCLIYNATEQSDFCAPNLDKVVNAVEDEFRKLYGFMEPDFSLRKLMRELCERFLEMGNLAATDEKIASSDQEVPSKIYDFMELPGSIDAPQLDFLIPSSSFDGSYIFQNLIQVTPQVSKPISLHGLDFLQSVTGFQMEHIKNICVASGKKLKVLKASNTKLSDSGGGWEYQPLLGVNKPYAYLDDVTKGEENIKISFVKGSAPDDLPSFIYIAHNVVYDKALVKFKLSSISDGGCSLLCTEDCLSSVRPCSCAQISGEFAYTSSGLVKERFLEECISLEEGTQKDCCFSCTRCPVIRSKTDTSFSCRGHIMRRFIKECWSRCGCSKRCGNRVVQRGITRNLQVFWTPEGKGWGLRTIESLPRGAFVCEYVGEIVTLSELYERNMQNMENRHPVALDAAWSLEDDLKDEEALFLDARDYGNIARFINHRCCDANLIQIPVEVESSHRYYHVALFTKREVAAMEELTWDYGYGFD